MSWLLAPRPCTLGVALWDGSPFGFLVPHAGGASVHRHSQIADGARAEVFLFWDAALTLSNLIFLHQPAKQTSVIFLLSICIP